MGLALRRRAVLGRAVLARPIELAPGKHGRFQPQPVLRKRLACARRRRLLRPPANPAAAGSPLSRRLRRRQRQAEGRASCCGEAGEGGKVRVHGIEGRARPKLYLQR